MASNYTGSPTATQSPGALPFARVNPIASLPSDGDALNAASVAQAFKESMDYIAFCTQNAAFCADNDMYLNEEFLGDTVPRHVFVAPSAACGVIDDSTNGATGALSVSDNSTDTSCETRPLKIGSSDFRLIARLRNGNAGIPGADIYFGIKSATAAEQLWFESLNSGTWGAKVGSAAAVSTGSASVNTYNYFEIRRTGNNVYFFVGGTQVYTAAFSTSIAVGKIHARANFVSGSGSIVVDAIRFWGRR